VKIEPNHACGATTFHPGLCMLQYMLSTMSGVFSPGKTCPSSAFTSQSKGALNDLSSKPRIEVQTLTQALIRAGLEFQALVKRFTPKLNADISLSISLSLARSLSFVPSLSCSRSRSLSLFFSLLTLTRAPGVLSDAEPRTP